MDAWPSNLYAVTLFVADVQRSKEWYRKAFGLPVHYEDDDSVVFDLNDTMINLLKAPAAARDLPGADDAGRQQQSGTRFELTILVDDVDAKHEELAAAGIEFDVEPTDRPWALRTGNFRDPDGHVWEIAHKIPGMAPPGRRNAPNPSR